MIISQRLSRMEAILATLIYPDLRKERTGGLFGRLLFPVPVMEATFPTRTMLHVSYKWIPSLFNQIFQPFIPSMSKLRINEMCITMKTTYTLAITYI